MQLLRSLLFYLLYFVMTAVLAAGVLAVTLFRGPWQAIWWFGHAWAHSGQFLLRHVVGLKTEISGTENIPEGPCIIATKHQSDWDSMAMVSVLRRPAFLIKKQLAAIPIVGQAMRALDCIVIDREAGARGTPQLMAEARAAMARGCQIFLYPEGTRREPFDETEYRGGLLLLYRGLKVPVVPVALHSGLFWPRKGITIYPGTARVTIFPAVPAGLGPEAFKRQIIEPMEAESRRLALEAAATISRALDPQLQQRIDAARATNH